MILSIERHIAFIHIPKTGGISVRLALQSHGEWLRPVKNFHVWGSVARDLLTPDVFYGQRWFAVIRHPVDAIVSSYKRTRERARTVQMDKIEDVAYRRYLQRSLTYDSVEDYAKENWIGDDDFNIKQGGFFFTYCCDSDGDPLPIRILRFERLCEDWDQLCEDWEIPYTPLPKANKSGDCETVPVSQSLRKAIEDYCWLDMERFGYR